ncbi:MAG: hypothetical protein PHQ04_05420 [Opitutaceae bacterium]|nr:hypothetical protein [Opitutaceae bacterium]
MKTLSFCRLALWFLLPVAAVGAWDFEGHRIINQLALAALPEDFPVLLPSRMSETGAGERIVWLSGEADRWRSATEPPTRHINSPDHFLDLEELGFAGLTPAAVSAFRYEFVGQYIRGRAANPERFPAIDPKKDPDHTRAWSGFLPWAITEYFGKLHANFGRLKVYEEFGFSADAAQTRASIVELMGTMGHFVGDGTQPLHTTLHYNGWVGDNPHGYTTARTIHQWIDGGFIRAAGINLDDLLPRVRPAQVIPLASTPGGRDPFFNSAMDYLQMQNALVEPLYLLEKEGKLKADGSPHSFEGRSFIEGQLLTGGEMLARIWVTAWRTAVPDAYLREELQQKGGFSDAKPLGAPGSPAQLP